MLSFCGGGIHIFQKRVADLERCSTCLVASDCALQGAVETASVEALPVFARQSCCTCLWMESLRRSHLASRANSLASSTLHRKQARLRCTRFDTLAQFPQSGLQKKRSLCNFFAGHCHAAPRPVKDYCGGARAVIQCAGGRSSREDVHQSTKTCRIKVNASLSIRALSCW